MIIINGNEDINENIDNEKIILDSGYYYGRGVFETMLVKGNKPLFLEQHYNRLMRGLSKLNIDKSIDKKYIIDIIQKYNLCDCVVKIIVSEKNIVVNTRQAPYKPDDYKNGFSLKVSAMKRNPYSHVSYIKTINYTDNILEKELATKKGYNEVLFYNTRDELAEGSSSNIFFVKESKIYTPEISCGILDGIVREWVIENFEVIEGKFYKDDLGQADEVFLTNSVMGIMKVNNIAGIKQYGKSPCCEYFRDSYERDMGTGSLEVEL